MASLAPFFKISDSILVSVKTFVKFQRFDAIFAILITWCFHLTQVFTLLIRTDNHSEMCSVTTY